MKNKFILFSVSLVAVLSVMFGAKAVYLNCQEDEIETGNIYSAQPVICGDATATTTYTYLTASGASSTCYAMIADADRVDLKWITVASSTSSVLNWKVYFADEDILADRTWYAEKNYTVTDNDTTTYSDNPTNRTMTLNDGGTAYHSTSVNNTNDRWIKVDYSATGANLGVHLEILPKSQIQ